MHLNLFLMWTLPQTTPQPRASWRWCPHQTGSAPHTPRTRRPHGTWGRRSLNRELCVPFL